MNTKLIALSVVVLLAASAIGVGYAYSATTDNKDNAIDVTYIALRSYDSEGSAPQYTKSFDVSGDDRIFWDTNTTLLKLVDKDTPATEERVWKLSTKAGENGHEQDGDDEGRSLILKTSLSDLDDNQAAVSIGAVVLSVEKTSDVTKYKFTMTDDIATISDEPYAIYAKAYTSTAITGTWTAIDGSWKCISGDAVSATIDFTPEGGLTAAALKVELYIVYEKYVDKAYDDDDTDPTVPVEGIVTEPGTVSDLNLKIESMNFTFKAEKYTA